MHIAYLVLDLGIPLGGVKGASVHVDAITTALRDAGHRVTILAASVADPAHVPEGVELVAFGSAERRTVRSVRDLIREHLPEYRLDRDLKSCLTAATTTSLLAERLRALDVDVVLERLSLFGVAGLAAARAVGVPHALEVNAPIASEASRHRQLTLGELANVLERRVIRDTDQVFTVSGPLAQHCRIIGAPADRVRVVVNGVDLDRFKSTGRRDAERRTLGFSTQDCVLGFVSTLRRWHGGRDLLRALEVLAPDLPNLTLLVVGDGPDAPEMRAFVAEAGLGERVRFTGAVPHETIPGLMEAVDIAVAPYQPSGDFYFSPLKLFEALSMGIPVVAPALETITDLIQDGESGRLYAAGDQDDLVRVLRELAIDADQRRALGRRARALAVERFSWRRAADEVSTDLVRLVNESSDHGQSARVSEVRAQVPAPLSASLVEPDGAPFVRGER